MFALNAFKSSIAARLSHRSISAHTKLAGIFKNESKEEEEQPFDIIEVEQEDPDEKQRRINRIRDKSGLWGQHRRLLHDVVPYEQSESWVHETLKYKRKIYAKYGSDSKIDPRICFWTKAELEEKQEYERVAYPKTVPEMMAIAKQQKREKQEKILAREHDISQKLLKLDQWKRDIEMKKEKKETDARIARERKDRLIEEVRRHFGYTIDPKDERFKEMLELKEKEQRKAQKASKRQDKESKMMAKLLSDEKNAKFVESKPKPDVDVDEESEKK